MATAEVAGKEQGKGKEPIPPADIRLSFPKKGKVQPSGWTGLGMDDEIVVTIRGKIKSLSDNSQDDWPTAGKEIRIEIGSCAFSSEKKPMGMDEALEEEKKTRKKV